MAGCVFLYIFIRYCAVVCMLLAIWLTARSERPSTCGAVRRGLRGVLRFGAAVFALPLQRSAAVTRLVREDTPPPTRRTRPPHVPRVHPPSHRAPTHNAHITQFYGFTSMAISIAAKMYLWRQRRG